MEGGEEAIFFSFGRQAWPIIRASTSGEVFPEKFFLSSRKGTYREKCDQIRLRFGT